MFFQTYRVLLSSDIIHVRRADMQSIDAYLHANPTLNPHKGLAMVFNPTAESFNSILLGKYALALANHCMS
jgi:hypothetical protein